MRIDEITDTAMGESTDVLVEARTLYRDHASVLHTYLARRVGRDLADDLLADTFRTAIEHWDAYDPGIGSARNWLYGIATNHVRRHWRTEQRRRRALDRLVALPATGLDDSRSPADTVAAHVDAATDVRCLLDAVSELPADDYDLLVLSAWESMSSADVAEVLGIPRGTVRSRLHRIRRQLDAARRRGAHPDPEGDPT